MTFAEIQTEIVDRLNLTSSDAATRVGRGINRYYKHVTTTCGLNTTRQVVGASETVTIGDPVVIFSDVEKIVKVYTVSGSTIRDLKEVPFLQLRDIQARTSDDPRYWAHQTGTGTTVSVRLDAAPATGYTIYADGYSTVSTLSGSDVPVVPVSFHDILVWGPLIDEYQKMGKVELSRDCKANFESRLSDLRLFLAKNAYQDVQQGGILPGRGTGAGGNNNVFAGQLAFPATQNPSSGANTLDDYEEGSWTPVITGSGGGSGQAYTSQLGRYVKVGKMVTVWGRVILSTLGTITGSVRIGALPFTAGSTTVYPGSIGHFAAFTTSYVWLTTYVHVGATQAEVVGLTAAATGVSGLAQADLSNTTDITFTITYEADA